MFYVYVIVFILYIISALSCLRMACYFCTKWKFMVFIPVINVCYFGYLVDIMMLEHYDVKHSYFKILISTMCVLLGVSVIFYKVASGEIMRLVADITLTTIVCLSFISLVAAYVTLATCAFEHAVFMSILSCFVPFPLIMLVASFTIKKRIEEVLLDWELSDIGDSQDC